MSPLAIPSMCCDALTAIRDNPPPFRDATDYMTTDYDGTLRCRLCGSRWHPSSSATKRDRIGIILELADEASMRGEHEAASLLRERMQKLIHQIRDEEEARICKPINHATKGTL